VRRSWDGGEVRGVAATTRAVGRPPTAPRGVASESALMGGPASARAVPTGLRDLGRCAVAEGVQTLTQAQELARTGATHLQRSGLAAPLTGADVTTWSAGAAR
jgi:hypothetical protein